MISGHFSEQERLDAFMNPGERVLSDEFIKKNKDKLLLFLIKRGISYPTEMSRETGFHINTVNKVLNVLKSEDHIKTIRPNKYNLQAVFEARNVGLQNAGFDSFEKVTRMHWWIPTELGVEYIKTNYKGQHKPILCALCEDYGFKVKYAEVTDVMQF
jgi:hypothetical protein